MKVQYNCWARWRASCKKKPTHQETHLEDITHSRCKLDEASHSRSPGLAETKSKPKSEPDSGLTLALNLRNRICFGH
ncbi:hypothetical protein CR513_06536, partial [Mucuna pruriens]